MTALSEIITLFGSEIVEKVATSCGKCSETCLIRRYNEYFRLQIYM